MVESLESERVVRLAAMSRRSATNVVRFWVDPRRVGISFLYADFAQHVYAPHFHEELVVAGTVAGGGRFISHQESQVACPERVIVFNPHEPHEGNTIHGHRWQYRAIYFSAAAVETVLEALNERNYGLPYFRNNNIADREVASLLIRTHQVLESSKDPMKRDTALFDLLAMLFSRHGDPPLRLPKLGGEKLLLRRTVDYLNAHLTRPVSISDLAAAVGYSEYHLIRTFRQKYGIPPHAYLLQMRLNRARRLLEEGRSIVQVACDAGFYDQSHLTRHFKRAYAVTPGQYASAMSKTDAAPADEWELSVARPERVSAERLCHRAAGGSGRGT